MDQHTLVNTIYHSAVISGLAVGYSSLLKKFFKYDVGDPAKADIMNMLKLTGIISLSVMTKSYLEKQAILPPMIGPTIGPK